MEAQTTTRILWAGAKGSAVAFPPGSYRTHVARPVRAALAAVEAAEAAGRPYAACFLEWGDDDFGPRDIADLLRMSPHLFLVVEGNEAELEDPSIFGGWGSPDRCLAVARPVPPFVRKSLAEHLGSRWLAEAVEKKRASVLETEADRNRVHTQRHEERLRILYGIVEKLHGAQSLEDALQVTLGEMSRFLGAKTGSLLVLEGVDRLRVLEAVGPHRDKILGIVVPLEESRIARYALEEREPILVEDIHESDRFRDSEEGIRFRARSILSVPLFSRGGPLGVLNFGGDARQPRFTEHDRDLVVTLGRQVAVALEKASLFEGLRQTVAESIRALAGAIEAKDHYTRGHSDRVTHYTRLIAEAMDLDSTKLDVLVRAAILHDVGKIGVPEAVLNKPGRLDSAEFGMIKRHPEVGVEIVREIRAMVETLPIIHAHHERIDGKGYPRGVRGADIPLGARILAVADTFDAMTSSRPYRQGLSDQAAYDEIERCSGSQFDPAVARVFLEGAPHWPDSTAYLSDSVPNRRPDVDLVRTIAPQSPFPASLATLSPNLA